MSRYLLLSEFFPPAFGGIEDTLARIADALGPRITVMAAPQPGDQEFDEQQKYEVIRRSLFSSRLRPRWLWLFPFLMKQRKSQSVILFGHHSPAVTAGWLASWFGVPYAVLVHGQDVLGVRSGWRGWLTKQNLRRASWIGTNSTFSQAMVHELGVPLGRIIINHPSIPDGRFTEPVGQTRHPHRLITIGRLVARKNVATVIKAVGQLKAKFPDLEYHVVGDGPEKQNLVALATSLGCERQVVFHGQIPDEKKWPLIDSSSVAVLVPKALEEGSDVEGLGLFLVEAASRGLALIGSNTGGIPDVVHDRQTGCVVDPEHTEALVESLSFLLASPEQAQRLGAQARDLASSEFRFGHRFSRLLTMAEPIAPAVQPLISVIIPVYETARLLPETLHSLFEQTWRKLEVIIVDDGSTDDVAEAIKPWAERVTYIRQENRGAPSARNKGASVSHGQFLFFLDADTVLQLKCLENMYRVLATHPAAAYAYADFRFGPKNFHGHDFDAPALRRLNYIHTSSLIRRDAFPGFDPDLKKFQDWDLWLTMLEQGKKGIWCPERLFWVRQRSGGMSQWLPKIAYQLPWIGQGHGHASIRRYRQGEAIIRKKHGLD